MEKSSKATLLFKTASSANQASEAEKADGVVGAVDSSESAEEAMDGYSDRLDCKDEEAFAEYARKLADNVMADIKMLEETCLIVGTPWPEPVKIMKLKQKLLAKWRSFVKGELEVVDLSNNWFLMRFPTETEKDLLWEGRPYHISGLLLVLMPWKPNFDATEAVATVDLWVRILSIPSEYMRFDLIQAVLEYNRIGELQKLDPHTENRSKAKYARVLVKIRYVPPLKGFVVLPNLENVKEKKILKLWYEGVSEGCNNCAETGHLFNDCPLILQGDSQRKLSMAFRNASTGIVIANVGEEAADVSFKSNPSSASSMIRRMGDMEVRKEDKKRKQGDVEDDAASSAFKWV